VLVPLALDGVYLVYRNVVLPSWAAHARQQAWVTPGIWFVSQWSALLYYVRLFVWPSHLSADHDFPYTTSVLSQRALLSLLGIGAWVALAIRAAKKYPQVTFATAWFFVTLAPESSFAPLAEVVNDHRPYIATSLGLSVLLAWALERGVAWAVPQARRLAFAVACLVLCVPAVAYDRYRTWQWSDPLRIWEDTVEKSPDNPRAWTNAGNQLMGRGEMVKARAYFERARQVGPMYAWAYMNLSVLDRHEGNLEGALRDAQEAVRLRPDQAQSHFYLGKALEALGRRDEAAAAYRRGVDVDPRETEAHEALARLTNGDDEASLMTAGLAALQTGKPEEAVGFFRKVLGRNPTHYGATFQLAAALDLAGQPGDARPLWEKVLGMAQGYGDKQTADTARARLARPDVLSEEALMSAGLDALYKRRDPAAAATVFRSVLDRNPTHYGATFQLAMDAHDAKTERTVRARLEQRG
jgi:tetratricopeptide (TPR) repeat protein